MPIDTNTAQLLGKIVAEIDSVGHIIAIIQQDIKDSRENQGEIFSTIKSLEGSLKNAENDIRDLMKVIRDGNGQPPVLVRLALVETAQSLTRSDISELKQSIDMASTAKIVTRGQIATGVFGMVATALLSLGAILAQLFRG